MTLTAEYAQRLAEKVYEDRRDKMGYQELEHVRAVAAAVPDYAEAVAWVHDTVEDGLLPFSLFYYSMDSDQFEALLLLTREKGRKQTYMQYIESIRDAEGRPGEIARRVKLADLRHNIRRPCPPEMTGMREPGGRYDRALQALESA